MTDWDHRFWKMDLVSHHVTRVSFDEWCQIHNPDNYSIAWTGNEGTYVSTVFLGIDHNFTGTAPGPVLFETMIFGGEFDGGQFRYCTYEEALQGHAEAVKTVFGYEYVP